MSSVAEDIMISKDMVCEKYCNACLVSKILVMIQIRNDAILVYYLAQVVPSYQRRGRWKSCSLISEILEYKHRGTTVGIVPQDTSIIESIMSALSSEVHY
jgi:hypothetical protein